MSRPVLRVLCTVFLAVSPLGHAGTPPNVVLILSDDHTHTHYGFMGHPDVRTPHLDRMAGEGLLFTRGYSMPVCSPSLATLLTGLMPHRHGITGNDLHAPTRKQQQDTGENRDPLRERVLRNPLLLPKALGDAGYLSFQTGKLWNTSFRDVGFTHGMTSERSRHGGAGLGIGREGMQPVADFIDLALGRKKPFFVWYAPLLPHDPHDPPERIFGKYRGTGPTPHAERYRAMVEWFDETCGELQRILESRGIQGNTLVIYLSDNGWDPLLGYAGTRAKLTPYENGVRTPLFLRWPGVIPARRDDTTPVSIVDVVPSILAAAGLPAPPELPGRNLRDVAATASPRPVFIEAYRHDIMDIERPAKSLTARAVIDGWKKLILPGPVRQDGSKAKFASIRGEIELFDLQQDPKETTNLATHHPHEVARLRGLLDAVWKVE